MFLKAANSDMDFDVIIHLKMSRFLKKYTYKKIAFLSCQVSDLPV